MPMTPKTEPTAIARLFTCGTRTVIERGPSDFRVLCATCEGGGTTKHTTRGEATRAAVRDSNKRCRKCGAD